MRQKAFFGVLVVAALVVAPASGQNLVTNGDFSAGGANWNVWQASWGNTVSMDYTGGIASHDVPSDNGSTGIYQVVHVGTGVSVSLDALWEGNANSGWAEVLAADIGTATPDINMVRDVLDSGPNVGNHIRTKHEENDWGNGFGESWSAIALSAEGGNNPVNPLSWTTSADYVIIATKAGNATTMWLDNITLTPEPASLAMLGLASLPLVLRRRRRA